MDLSTRQLLRGACDVHLSPKAFDLLTALLEARPRALSKNDLHARLWPDTFVSEANLAVLVAEIRSAIGDDARAPRFVRTVQRHGYAFHGNATDVVPAESSAPSNFKHWLVAPFRQIPLTPGENVVGRDPGAQVWLDSASVSRRHARITIDGEHVTVEDLRSKNGTQVHGRQAKAPVPLADGDEITFGSITVTFRVWAAGEATRTDPLW
jgi:DNA-binding winged helix-turn-helix (wHTH) protein